MGASYSDYIETAAGRENSIDGSSRFPAESLSYRSSEEAGSDAGHTLSASTPATELDLSPAPPARAQTTSLESAPRPRHSYLMPSGGSSAGRRTERPPPLQRSQTAYAGPGPGSPHHSIKSQMVRSPTAHPTPDRRMLLRQSSLSSAQMTAGWRALARRSRHSAYLTAARVLLRGHGQATRGHRLLSDAATPQDVTLLTCAQMPMGAQVRMGGVVAARSIKCLERLRSDSLDREARDRWWAELRAEVRSHALQLRCHAIVGYQERAVIDEDVCILSATGTAVRVRSLRRVILQVGNKGA